ncbi:MFS transporter [Reinekea blandensis]|uniref:MFS transporter n=1 Tax=Reinekea blandensis TaxID=374838 RepID=UPI000303BA50|nr:MFS transporter [Reinekea blandensis]
MSNTWKKTALLFLSSQTLSLFGTMLVQYAILWYITLEAKSGVMLSLLIVIGVLPMLFLSPFAGVWADRYDRKKLIILSDSLVALTTLGLAIAFALGYEAYWLFFLASFLRAIGQGIQMPAVAAFVPQFVPKEHLMRVNGLLGSIQAATMLVAPMAAGALMSIAPLQTIFYIDVVTAALAVLVMTVFVRVPPHARASNPAAEKTATFHDLKLGFRYVRHHTYLTRFFLFSALFMFLVAPVAFLTPLQVARSFGEDVWRLTAIEVLFSIGMMLGGGLLSIWGGFRNRVYTMMLATVIVGSFTIALGLVPWFWVYLVLMGVVGISMPLFNTPATVLLQEHVEEAYMGRVFSVMTMISSSAMPAGMLMFGPLGDVIAIEWLLIGTGAGIVLLGVALKRSRVLIDAGWPESTVSETSDPTPESTTD